MTNAKYLAIVLGVALFALIAPVHAASMSITSVTIPTSVNQGESFTITAQLTSSGVNTGQAQLSGSPLPTQIGCTPTSAQSVTLSGGSGSASWNCTGSVAGDYSNGITVTVTDADGQAPQATTQTGLTVLAPASITVSATTSSSSVDMSCGTSASFNYTVGVNNAGDVSATGVSVTPSISGITSYTSTPSSYGSQTVSGKSLRNFDFIIRATTTGTMAFGGITVTSTNAGSGATVARNVTIANSTSACPVAATPAPTGAGGSSSVAPTVVQESTTIDTILAGTSKTVTVTKAAETGVNAIKIAVKNTVTSVKITTAQVTSLPASIPAPTTTGGIYKYVDITATIQSGDIDKVTISFQVARAWVTANNINLATIALSRWADSKWNKLASTKTSEDSTYYYFDAESPGLSTFAVTGEKVAAALTPTATPTVTTTGAPITATPTASPAPGGISIPFIPGQPPIQIPMWLIVVAVVIVVAYFIYKKKMSSAGEKSRYSYQQKK